MQHRFCENNVTRSHKLALFCESSVCFVILGIVRAIHKRRVRSARMWHLLSARATLCSEDSIKPGPSGSVFTDFSPDPHDTESRIAWNNGLKESSGFVSDYTSVKIVERESVKQLSTATLRYSQSTKVKVKHSGAYAWHVNS